ncbi:MAG: carbamoyltransferase HypF [Myxococcales bacterium]|nr:carbamoyltransferase HypF [Myxococcales bacterium]
MAQSPSLPLLSEEQRGERINIRGIVQGVGFRPTVARLASIQGLRGWVKNGPSGVTILLAANKEACDRFLSSLQDALPPLARIASLERIEVTTTEEERQHFTIHKSQPGPLQTMVPPDAAVCSACIAEIHDPQARRYRYAFTCCTHCGPRYSIIQKMPYDRPYTTMQAFSMCQACKEEYEDPQDRRYHAQPIACPACGPQLSLESMPLCLESEELSHLVFSSKETIPKAQDLLAAGAILAIKGLGGYQLCCDATQPETVAKLRKRKQRSFKPFAIMVHSVETIESYAHLNTTAQQQLTSPAAPIVLLEKKSHADSSEYVIPLALDVAPWQNKLGVMLPTTPLHHLLLRDYPRPIVCTSGNLTGEPQCTKAEEARNRLGRIADILLTHDRPISHRIDDAVIWVDEDTPRMIRRARGYAPTPISLPPGFTKAPTLLALGGQDKSAFCLLHDGYAFLSPHLGHLDNYATQQAWEKDLHELLEVFQAEPQCLAVDGHPSYSATRYGQELAERLGVPLATIQHHHAHIAACLAEHNYPVTGPAVLGIALDGLGLGPEGELWGGEFLLAGYQSARKIGGLQRLPLFGGDLAAREPWRNLYAHLYDAIPFETWPQQLEGLPFWKDLKDRPHELLHQVMQREQLTPKTSSCGRWFDAVAAALGLFPHATEEEGQAAIALSSLVTSVWIDKLEQEPRYPLDIIEQMGCPTLSPQKMWWALCDDLRQGHPKEAIATRFHLSLADAISRMAQRLCKNNACQTVALGGGVWQNHVLLQRVRSTLQSQGLEVLVPQEIPTHDGGLAFGQAVIAAAQMLATPSNH